MSAGGIVRSHVPRAVRNPVRFGLYTQRGLVVAVLSLVLTAITGLAPVTAHASAGTYRHVVLASGRSFDLYLPAQLPVAPEIYLVLHGRGQHADHAEATFGMSQEADVHHFLVAYPQGYGSTWNAGTCCASAGSPPPDDVAFLDQVIASIRHAHPLASPRVRIVGFSTGGMMAYTYACQRPQVTGAGAVSGAWVAVKACGRRGLRVYHAHGRADAYVPYEGGYSPLVGATFEPVPQLRSHFPADTAFRLHTVDDGIHAWPPFAADEIWQWLR